MPINKSLLNRIEQLEASNAKDPDALASRINDYLNEMIRTMPCDFKTIDFSQTKLRLLRVHQKAEDKS